MASQIGVTICRSDGVPQYTLNNEIIANRPKVEPDNNGRVYQKLGPDDAKEFDWRKKLGTALMEHMNSIEPGKIERDKEYVLTRLPEGYSLWIHSAPDGGSGAQKTKVRTDAYLYGHPLGNTKRFRSAQEFKPHLIWLAMDEEGDPKNCVCKVCKPKGATMTKLTGAETTAAKPVSTAVQSDVISTREQLLDSDPSVPYIYRPGELVWFNKGTAWGLAVICKRQMINSLPYYHLQPLSHPLRHCLSVAKNQEDLRPWLAWTLPNTTHRQINNLKYDAVPWERVLNGEFGNGDTEVDGSILIGKEINNSYTLFGPLGTKTVNQDGVCYTGIFLGAEKIWVGEAIRLQAASNDIVIMVIEAIIDENIATTVTSSSTTVIGDIYTFSQMYLPPIYKDRKNWPTPRLPSRMVADLQWRNENSVDVGRNIWSEWQLKESRAKKALSAVRGRWYETRRLLPILRAEEFEKEVSEGTTYDAGVWMNSRFDAVNDTLSRKKTRLDAFGRSVPKDLKISLGIDRSPGDDKFPDEQSKGQLGNAPANNGQYGLMGVKAEEARGYFMDVDPPAVHQDFRGNTMQR